MDPSRLGIKLSKVEAISAKNMFVDPATFLPSNLLEESLIE